MHFAAAAAAECVKSLKLDPAECGFTFQKNEDSSK